MNEYYFHEGALPPGYKFDFEVSLFNQHEHRVLQASDGWKSFYILHEKDKCIKAAVHFHLSGNVASSPLRSPFGSVEYSTSLPDSTLLSFLKFFISSLKNKGASSIVIKTPPQAYAPDTVVLLQTLLQVLGFKVAGAEVSSVIEVSSPDATTHFYRSKKTRIKKSLQAGLVFRIMKIDDLEKVYNFICHCRSEKGYNLSMSLAELKITVEQFPDRFFLFAVFDETQIVAASVAVCVRKNVLYDFYHDHDSFYNHLSPVVLLVEGMYKFCHRHNIKLLDLGTSSADGRPNPGLLHFKKSLGGTPTPKLTFAKNLRHE